jgi:hypothetical protein
MGGRAVRQIRMPFSEEAREAVLDYLRQEFGGSAVTHETTAGDLAVVVEQGENRYAIEVDENFLRDYSPAEITACLRQWNLASELQRAEGMEFSVSEAGVRLASSN